MSADEAKQLGTTLTAVGAEKAGNKDGTIPEYTGGLKEIPASFKKGSGIRPSPFESEKPRLVIDGKNAAQHADKLTEGTKELLKRYPDDAPRRVPDAARGRVAAEGARQHREERDGAKSVNGGLGVEGMLPGVPFPIPKTGNEAMWNHLVRYTGVAYNAEVRELERRLRGRGVARRPRATSPTSFRCTTRSAPDAVAKETDPYWKLKLAYTGPARRAGEALMAIDSVNPIAQPRRAWQYLPGQRRVKLAPDLAYDTPNAGTARHVDVLRRVRVQRRDGPLRLEARRQEGDVRPVQRLQAHVREGRRSRAPRRITSTRTSCAGSCIACGSWKRTLKPGQRDLYSKRVFYLDEDSWVALAADQYDAKGQLYRSTLAQHDVQLRRQRRQRRQLRVLRLRVGRRIRWSAAAGMSDGMRYIDPLPELQWSSGVARRRPASANAYNRRRLGPPREVSLHPRAAVRAGYFSSTRHTHEPA